jgi:hypothetical protein
MKILNFNGYHSPSSCEYGIGEIEGKVAIVLYQRKLSGTSITNMIEHLTVRIMAEEIPETPPENIRVFEHYNPELNPIYEWAEVLFSKSGVIDDGKSIIKKILEVIFSSGKPPKYYVDSPQWHKISDQDKEILSAID